MEKVIAHIDLDSFYASVECLYNPKIRDFPVAVVGDFNARCGIVLAKNQLAKVSKVKTGDTLFEAKLKSPNIIFVKANFDRYLKVSKLAKKIYSEYTDKVESFGIDEAWLDLTGSTSLFGSPLSIANEIQKRIIDELGITASIGISFNKVFAKLGSDQNKPNGIFVVNRDDYKEKVWNLPVSDLLYVGRSTTKKFTKLNIKTIGDLANYDETVLCSHLGKAGSMLKTFANGDDKTEITKNTDNREIKSIGNSITLPRDLETLDEVKSVFYMLAESVATRLRKENLKCNLIQIHIRDNELSSLERQGHLSTPSFLSNDIAKKALDIFINKHIFDTPIRSLGIRACSFSNKDNTQLDFFIDNKKIEKLEKAEKTIDKIRGVYGYYSVQKGILLLDKSISGKDISSKNVIHPTAYILNKGV